MFDLRVVYYYINLSTITIHKFKRPIDCTILGTITDKEAAGVSFCC